MAWYPRAVKMELQPESSTQQAIRPTQVIYHSIAAPWTPKRTYEYWRDSTNLESHFGLGFDGTLWQYLGTQTRADANYRANRRADGTGAISLESASNLDHTDPWTDEQVEELIKLGVWAHKTHPDIPLRICRSASDPGFGYHRLHSDWALGGTDCPGDARVKQFRELVFPAIVARATGAPEPTKPTTPSVPPTPRRRRRPVAYRLTGA
ncbi:N-acetylmuramoyl-L-alanine amidase [Streptomyces virginiae]|uniref:N-acetylmuramoyl-L-alanine amidase n=1 Tax=Streptomyces virginiae TaxID=1961 RepID=UPI0036B94365